MSAPTQKKTKIRGGQLATTEPEVFLLYEGGEVEELRSKLTHVRIAPHVKEIPDGAFSCCHKLAKVHLNEGLQTVEKSAFEGCRALQSVAIPSTVTELGRHAFYFCTNLTEVQLNERSEEHTS